MKTPEVTGMKTSSKLPAKVDELSTVPQHQVSMYMSDLTEKVVKQYFAPGDATKTDIVAFLGLCKAQDLNPWNKDAFLIPFYGQEGRKYAVATAYQVLLDRGDPFVEGLEIECEPDTDMPERCTVTVWRKGWKIPFKRTTLMTQVMRFKRNGDPMALWETNPRAMLEKCSVSAAYRMGVPACRRLYTEEEFYAGNQEAIQSQVQPEIAEAEVVSAEAIDTDAVGIDRDYYRGQYFKWGKAVFGDDDDTRHDWNKTYIGKESTRHFTDPELVKAVDLLESQHEQHVIIPATDEDGAGEPSTTEAEVEVEMDTAESVQAKLDAQLISKREEIVMLISEMLRIFPDTPIKSIDTPAFTTWWKGKLPEEADKDFDDLDVLSLNVIIGCIEAHQDREADGAAEDNGADNDTDADELF